jgi:hypothetical protein
MGEVNRSEPADRAERGDLDPGGGAA